MKKPIGILLTDLHLTKDNGDLVKSIVKQAIKLALIFKVKHIFNAGDSFTNRSGQPLSTLTDFQEIIDMVEEADLVLHIIPGNHDKTDADDEKSYLDLYVRDTTRIYREATQRNIGGVMFHFMPYFHDEKWLEQFKTLKLSSNCKNVMITHSGFDGVMNNDGSKVESEIKPSMMKDFDMVYIGHYHNASWIADNVRYAGSAYQNNFGENITDKGFNIIYDDGSFKFMPSKFPKYIKEVIEASDIETTRNLMEKYDGDDYNHIRFLFRGTKLEFERVNVSEIQKLGIDVKFESIEEVEAREMSESESVLLYDKQSILKDFIAFSKQQSINGKQLLYGIRLMKNL